MYLDTRSISTQPFVHHLVGGEAVSHVSLLAMQDLAKQVVLCRLAAQVSQYYMDVEELDSIQQLRKYLGQVLVSNHLNRINSLFPRKTQVII